jgi:hypothetical protein
LAVPLGDVANDIRIACEELNRRGCSARMREVRYCGERELRLVVRQPGGRIAVELLAPSEEVAADCWQAVRVDRNRTVWCGPARIDVVSGLDLVPFVVDLLSQPVSVLAVKYRGRGLGRPAGPVDDAAGGYGDRPAAPWAEVLPP